MFRALATAAILLATPAAAADYRAAGLEATGPWSRPAAAGTNGAGFMTLANRGKKADALVAVESPAARSVEIHRSSMSNGVMSMSRQARLALPAGGSVTLAPGGYHLMFLGLKAPLRPGDAAPAVLVFASGTRLAVKFAVSDGSGPAMPMDHHH